MQTDQEVEQLVEANTGLVAFVVGRTLRLFARLPVGYDREDLHSLGSLGLVRAARTFDSARGVTFSTYAYRCITNSIAGTLKQEINRQIDCISLSTTLGEDQDNVIEDQIIDQDADTTRTALQGCDREMLESAIQELSVRQAQVIQALYFNGDSVHQVSVRWSLSMQAVQNQHLRALRTLRGRLRHLGFQRPER